MFSFPTSSCTLDQTPLEPADARVRRLQPLIFHRLSCGFPLPGDDVTEARLDLNDLMIQNSNATFFFRVQGDSMAGIGLVDGSFVVVDRSITPRSGHVVVAIVNSEYTVKRLVKRGECFELHPENPRYQPFVFTETDEMTVWGVVTGWAHRLSP